MRATSYGHARGVDAMVAGANNNKCEPRPCELGQSELRSEPNSEALVERAAVASASLERGSGTLTLQR